MAAPPPSPLPDNNVIAALQTAADDSTTPYRSSTGCALAMLQFSAGHQASTITTMVGHILWPHPRLKKQLNTIEYPQLHVTIFEEAPWDVDLNGTGLGQLHFDEQPPIPAMAVISHKPLAMKVAAAAAALFHHWCPKRIHLDLNSGIIHHQHNYSVLRDWEQTSLLSNSLDWDTNNKQQSARASNFGAQYMQQLIGITEHIHLQIRSG